MMQQPHSKFYAMKLLLKDRRGISAIEFSLLFPIIAALLAGTVDFGQALMVDRKMNQVVATTSDMIAQNSSWTTTGADNILSGAATILQPFNTSKLTLLVAVINIDKDDNQTVVWSRAYNTSPLADGSKSPVPIPENIEEKDVQMVVSKATYSLSTPFATFLKPVTGVSSYNYTRTSIDRPRRSDTIQLN